MVRSRIMLSLLMVGVSMTVPEAAPAAWSAPPPVTRAVCGPGSHPESGMQGRVSTHDIQSGYAADGIRCNAEIVGRFGGKGLLAGGAGGYKVLRYVDSDGRECAYYDTALAPPFTLPKAGTDGHGVYVLDMSDPAHPLKTANLTTPAMLSPHESLNLSVSRGLLVAVAGFSVNPGIMDVYDIAEDCRRPRLVSSTPFGIVGHEGNFSPDGRTFWAASGGLFGLPTLSAVDLTDPANPRLVWFSTDHSFHGFSLSDDGNRLYAADFTLGQRGAGGLKILDVSQVQARVPSPVVTQVATLSWETWSLPQMTIPISVDAHPYLVEIDEFARGNRNGDPEAPIGAARIIDIADERRPVVVSDIRLEVHQPENVAAVAGDPGASWGFGGYSGHYCSVPQRRDPGILACSFILSGLRIFDIRDPLSPKEIAYLNAPIPPAGSIEDAAGSRIPLNAAYAMSGPSFVPERDEIWYSDGTFGFFAVRITNGAFSGSSVTAAG